MSQFKRVQAAYDARSPIEDSPAEEAYYDELEAEDSIRTSLNLGDHWEYVGDGEFQTTWSTKHVCRRDHKSGVIKVGDRYTVTMTKTLSVERGKVRTFLSKQLWRMTGDLPYAILHKIRRQPRTSIAHVVDLVEVCEEHGGPFDDNPGKPICKTCEDWRVTD